MFVPLIVTTGYFPARFNPDYMIENDDNLTDDSPETCLTFHDEEERPTKI